MANKTLEIRTKSGEIIKGNLYSLGSGSNSVKEDKIGDIEEFMNCFGRGYVDCILVEYKQFFKKKIKRIQKDSIESVTLYPKQFE